MDSGFFVQCDPTHVGPGGPEIWIKVVENLRM